MVQRATKAFLAAVSRFQKVSNRLDGARADPSRHFELPGASLLAVTLREIEFRSAASWYVFGHYDALLRHAKKFDLDPCPRQTAEEIFKKCAAELPGGQNYIFALPSLVFTPDDDGPGNNSSMYHMENDSELGPYAGLMSWSGSGAGYLFVFIDAKESRECSQH